MSYKTNQYTGLPDYYETDAVSSVSNSDGTLTISPTTGSVVASRAAITGDVSIPGGSNTAVISGLSATKISSGVVDNTEFDYLNGVTSAIQTQLNGKQASGTYVTGATDSTLTLTSTTLGINLATANTWTAKQTIQLATEQLRLGYNASNYSNFVVGSAGTLSVGLNGGNASFQFQRGISNVTPTLAVINTDATSKAAALICGTAGAGFAFSTDNSGFFGIQAETKAAIVGGTAGIGTTLFKIYGTGNIEMGSGASTVKTTGAMGIGGGSYANLTSQHAFIAHTATNQNITFRNLQSITQAQIGCGNDADSNYVQLLIDGNPLSLCSQGTNKVGIGHTGTPSAQLHIIKTTEQLRVGYDASNYFSTTVGSAGAVTFNAVGASAGFAFSDPVNITSSLQCDSIVNDTGLAHGTYTPTLTGVANVTSTTARQCTYMRVGNTVTVAGQLSVVPSGAGIISIGISLPVASNFSTTYQAGGSGHCAAAITGHGMFIEADATNDRVQADYYDAVGSSDDFSFTFTYEVI